MKAKRLIPSLLVFLALVSAAMTTKLEILQKLAAVAAMVFAVHFAMWLIVRYYVENDAQLQRADSAANKRLWEVTLVLLSGLLLTFLWNVQSSWIIVTAALLVLNRYIFFYLPRDTRRLE
jgi:uncharacterized membrane protein YadS